MYIVSVGDESLYSSFMFLLTTQVRISQAVTSNITCFRKLCTRGVRSRAILQHVDVQRAVKTKYRPTVDSHMRQDACSTCLIRSRQQLHDDFGEIVRMCRGIPTSRANSERTAKPPPPISIKISLSHSTHSLPFAFPLIAKFPNAPQTHSPPSSPASHTPPAPAKPGRPSKTPRATPRRPPAGGAAAR